MKNSIFVYLFLFIITGFSLSSCKNAQQQEAVKASGDTTSIKWQPADWSQNATIYEVNLRQYTPEGNIAGFAKSLPRLKKMGIDILWFMPIFPISKTNRKGTLGSPYAVDNYTAVNPDYGTLADFKSLVDSCHALGMKVILDWVPNHTGWDNPWIKDHPDWYTHINGKITDPIGDDGKSWGWADVADLNYDNKEMRQAMIEALQFWIKEADVDGYRCDVAGAVPSDFWAEVRPALESVKKPLFMLAENEDKTDLFTVCFDANYGWPYHNVIHDIAQGKKKASALDTLLASDRAKLPAHAYHMIFTTNHDENSWNGTEKEKFGEGMGVFEVLSFTFEGMPLIYSGQESGLDKRLEFFEKDPIDWKNYPKADFYAKLIALKHRNKALWNGLAGAKVTKIPTNHDDKVYAFTREKDGDKVIVVCNLSKESVEVTLQGDRFVGEYSNLFGNSTTPLMKDMMLSLKPWDYLVLSNK